MQKPSREELKQYYEHKNMSELIKRVREDKNMTYQDIADRLKNPSITAKEIKEYEEMKVIVPREILEPLSGVLGVSCNDLRVFAGYNSVDPVVHYFTPEGEEINVWEIISKIFYRDPSVLPHLYEIVFDNVDSHKETINVEGRKERLEGIASLVKRVQILRYIDDKQFAEVLMVTEDEVKEVHYLADNEISTNLLFRLHYAATVLFENPYLEDFDHNQVGELKKACQDEISRRDNI